MDLQIVETLVLVVHVLAALAIIGLVLIQHGKGAEMGSGFGGGASNTVFGSSGSGNFLTRATTALAMTFFLTSFGLAYFAKEHAVEARQLGMPTIVQPSTPTPSDTDKSVKGSSDSEIPATAAPNDADTGKKAPKQ